MIKYVLDSQVNRLIGITEDNQINLYSSEYGNIDYVYIVKEEGELDYYGQCYLFQYNLFDPKSNL